MTTAVEPTFITPMLRYGEHPPLEWVVDSGTPKASTMVTSPSSYEPF